MNLRSITQKKPKYLLMERVCLMVIAEEKSMKNWQTVAVDTAVQSPAVSATAT